MPGWLQVINHVNPLGYEVDALRGLLIGVPAGLGLDFGVLILAVRAHDRNRLRPTRPVSPLITGKPGWIRRLAGYLLSHRRNVVLALTGAVLGSACQVARPADRAADRRRRHRRPPRRAVALAGRCCSSPPALTFGLRLPAPLPRRPGRARRAVRPAQRHARPPADDGPRRPSTGCRPASSCPGPTPTPTLVQGLLNFLPIMSGNVLLMVLSLGRHVRAVAAAGAASAWSSRRRCSSISYRMRGAGVPGHLGRPAARGRRRADRRRGRQRRAGRQGVRAGRRASCERLADAAADALRLADARGPAPGALPAAAGGDPDARRRSPSWPSAAGWRCTAQITHRHVPRLLHLRRPVRRAGPAARRRPHRRPAGPGRRRAHLPAARPAPGHRRRARTPSTLPERRAARSPSTTCTSATATAPRCSTASTCTSPPASGSRSSGASGSGKSTVAPLLVSRFHDPTRGAVLRRRPRRARRDAALAAPPGRRGVRGELPVLRHGPAPTSPTAARTRPTTRSRPRPGPPQAHEFIDRPAARLRHRGRRARADACPAGSASASRWPGRSSPTRAILILDDATSAVDATHRGGHPRRPARGAGRPDHAADRAPRSRRCTWPTASSCSTAAGSSTQGTPRRADRAQRASTARLLSGLDDGAGARAAGDGIEALAR